MSLFKKNILAHNRVADQYKIEHVEIYNNVEQNRLRKSLNYALRLAKKDLKHITALDFGAGDGNLTDHLVSFGCKVISADISKSFLSRIRSRYKVEKVTTLLISEENKISLPDTSVDFIGVYSVLHHIDDYIAIFDEFRRIMKPHGIIYIDHENAASFWDYSPEQKLQYKAFLSHRKKPIGRYFKINNYVDWFIRKFINKKFQREGDIHVWEDDHIEWELIEKKIADWASVEVYKEYLLYRGGFDMDIYNSAKSRLYDMAYMVIRAKV